VVCLVGYRVSSRHDHTLQMFKINGQGQRSR